MPQRVDVELEDWIGSPVVRLVRPGYARLPASSYQDEPAQLTARQAVFLRNLVRFAEAINTGDIPVDFTVGGAHLYLDRGCVKMAVHSGFLQELVNGPEGVVESVRLSWDVTGERRSPASPA